MTQLVTRAAAPEDPAPSGAAGTPVRRMRVVALFTVALAVTVGLAIVHVTQGTASVGAGDLLRYTFGQGVDQTAAVFVASRLPRLLAGVLVGVALGFSGATLQSIARNPLAAPDTLGVNAGAYLAVVMGAALGLSLPVVPAGALAFVGGLLAAGLVLTLSAGGAGGTTRLILAGSAVALALHALTVLFLLLFGEATVGLFAWGAGSLVQTNLRTVAQMAPVVLAAIGGAMLLAHRLDLLALGEDTAAVLGLAVRRTRVLAVLVAVLSCAAAVTVAGPVGFVGLVAPVLVRLTARRAPEVHRHRVLLPLSGLTGVIVVLGADVLLRAVLGGQGGVDIPTGIVTTLFGAGVLVWLASRFRDSGPSRQPPGTSGVGARSRRRFVVVMVAAAALLLGAVALGLLGGDLWVLGGDLVNWVTGRSGRVVTLVLGARFPRVLAALLSGAALAIAGTVVQAMCRNPLAEPGLLGITGGAGVAAVITLLIFPAVGIWGVTAAAAAGAMAAFVLVYGLAARGGLASDRLVLIGIGVWQGASALISFVILVTNPWNVALALTWLSGSTYGRTLAQVVPVLLALVVLTPVAAVVHRELDLVRLDDDTPRVLGVPLERVRLTALAAAALMTAAAVSAIGVVGFVGLVAPHMARALVGSHHRRVLPLAAVLGAAIVSIADTVGRSVIAPAQIPAGLLTALIGTPYFVWLLWRARSSTAPR